MAIFQNMKVIIIEDEKPAAEKLQKALARIDPGIEISAILKSVESAVKWLKDHPSADLIFMDIELTDGSSFRIFDEVNISCPVIFITAYDEYWQAAFEHNSIDYLLKPLREEKLSAALAKYEKLKKYFRENFSQLQEYNKTPVPGEYKKRFLVKLGSDYVSVKTPDIAYFYATHKLVCMVDEAGRKFILDQSLSDIEKQLDPAMYYRVNRKYLVNMNAIKKIKTWPKSKLLLEVEPPVNDEIVVSQENAMAFKEWMER